MPRCSFVRATVVVTIITLSRPPSFSLLPRSSSRPGRAIPSRCCRPPLSSSSSAAAVGPLYYCFGHKHRVPFARKQRLRRIATPTYRGNGLCVVVHLPCTRHTHTRGCWSAHHEPEPASGVQTLRRLHHGRPVDRPSIPPRPREISIDNHAITINSLSPDSLRPTLSSPVFPNSRVPSLRASSSSMSH